MEKTRENSWQNRRKWLKFVLRIIPHEFISIFCPEIFSYLTDCYHGDNDITLHHIYIMIYIKLCAVLEFK